MYGVDSNTKRQTGKASTSTFQTYSDAPRGGVEPWHAMDVRSKVCEASKCIHWLQLVPQSMQLYSCTQHLALSGVSYILEPFSEIQIVSTNHPRYLVQYKYEYIYNYILYECFCLSPPALNIFRLLRSKARRGRTYHTITGTSVLHRHESRGVEANLDLHLS